MSEQHKGNESPLLLVMAFIIGLLVGVLGSMFFGGNSSPAPVATAPQAVAPPASGVNMQQKVDTMLQVTAADPSNRNAWVQLGHAYFDTDQPMKAVDAYDKALALDANDPNVLTDQGVMFRKLGWFDRAIENFEKAGDLDPRHTQSLFNMGIVYRYDLNDFDKAVTVWKKLLALNQPEPMAGQVRQEVSFLESHPQVNGEPPKGFGQ
ncbi:MAG: hypothetical protein C0624_08755 [Desulfuromonas sp.]|nr:MAG: hypothetical protein C0624_08755 [Desulfuromonas sp.]